MADKLDGQMHTDGRRTMLTWPRCRRDDPGAVWNGVQWRCPPCGVASIYVPAAGVFVGAARRALRVAETVWVPYWRRPADAPAPSQHGPRVVFRGTRDGVQVGGLS